MLIVTQSTTFRLWLTGLRDQRIRHIIATRIERLRHGQFGDVSYVGSGIHELRIHIGPGYHVYFMRKGKEIVILLCGGDKNSQQRDLENARRIAQDWR